jgi:arsenite methyltransferase
MWLSDISQDLLDFCRQAAADQGDLARCLFVHTPADDLSPIDDASVDVVTTRSVLIYVADKRSAFAEFARVLRAGDASRSPSRSTASPSAQAASGPAST